MSFQDIINIENSKQQRNIELYESIYNKVTDKINRQVKLSNFNNQKNCYYTIPAIVFGYPLINIPKTMEYILGKLNKEGFIAFQLNDDTIYISWELESVIKNEKQSKIGFNKTTPSNDHDDELTTLLLKYKRKT